jgi:hypothetical protein
MENTRKSKNKIIISLLAAVVLILVSGSFVIAEHGSGEGTFMYKSDLAGSAEVPAIPTSTAGEVKVWVNESLDAAAYDITLTDGNAIIASHLHCAIEGENGPVFAFLFGNIPGGFNVDGLLAHFTLTDANILEAGSSCPTAITDIASLKDALDAGEVYANVHSVIYPSGEVRGQLAFMEPDDGGDGEGDDGEEDDDGDGDGGGDDARKRAERPKGPIRER